MNFHILTLFPDMMRTVLGTSITGRAEENGILSFDIRNIRDYTLIADDRVDDYPYGGGAGLVIAAQPVYDAWKAVLGDIGAEKKPRCLYMSPKGRAFSQDMAKELAREEDLIILCGHYEGIDERVLDAIGAEEVSIGDYVLTGGEIPAMAVVDAVSRMIPGVLNNSESGETESFEGGLLEYPQYTRPENWDGKCVPALLLSGDHAAVEAWRREKALERTLAGRRDLLKDAVLSREDMKFILAKENEI